MSTSLMYSLVSMSGNENRMPNRLLPLASFQSKGSIGTREVLKNPFEAEEKRKSTNLSTAKKIDRLYLA